MCDVCKPILQYFHSHDSHSEAFKDYFSALKNLRDMSFAEVIEFVAGDCKLTDIEKHIEREDMYTIKHYFRCKCNQIFFVGYCCRGWPICKIVDEIPTTENYWDGKIGSYGSWKI